MKSIQILMDEHRLIERGLNVLNSIAVEYNKSKEIIVQDVQNMIHFIQDFADDFHHKKEEDILFAWMREQGFPTDGGPIHCMLEEHNVGRRYVTIIEQELKNHPQPEASTSVINAMLELSNHLNAHIYKEDHMLYPMVINMAQGGDGDQEILKRYSQKVSDKESTQTLQKHTTLIEELEAKYTQ